ncbi:unnamed protein product [Adineta steineri]|uniref:Uncharacterized protein n=1 Tax=Adineta steineri TaxID=433720 RepID=A0A819MH98_9BILA|nr:unnamed protein product [Adineta steineri]CAF3980163.1 unnamed protein product [Adineta steineri]CAF4010640.1 unnamed protein product [Adineta steineri]
MVFDSSLKELSVQHYLTVAIWQHPVGKEPTTTSTSTTTTTTKTTTTTTTTTTKTTTTTTTTATKTTTTTTTTKTTTTTTTTTTPGCHTCFGSSYTNSCSGCSTSSAGCTISCTCSGGSNGLTNSSITLSPGFGNGCFVENVSGYLQCTSHCT